MVGREHRFGTGIAQWTITIGFSVFWVFVAGCSRNGYGTSSNYWAQKKFIKFKQTTQINWLRPADFFGKFFSDAPLNSLRSQGVVLLSHSRIKCVLWLTVPCIFRCFSLFSFIRQSFHVFERKVLLSCEDLVGFLFLFHRRMSPFTMRKSFNRSKQLPFSWKKLH